MTKTGGFKQVIPQRSFRLLIGAQGLWSLFFMSMVIWWGSIIRDQVHRIMELESSLSMRLGTSLEKIHDEGQRTLRMIYWESAAILFLIFVSTALLFWLYWRDRQRSKGIQAFFASVTHELKTPLTSIRLQAESIADHLRDSSSQPLIDRLLQDTSRLESQVERTLELARVEGGGLNFTHPTALSPLVTKITSQAIETHGKDILQIDLQLDKTSFVEGDPAAIQVILKNLIENTLRHGTSSSEPKKLTVSIQERKEQDWIILNYRDNGNGFSEPSDSLGKLFQKGEHSQGAGVGLYLVVELMKRMGGKIIFEGKNGFQADLYFLKARESDV